jgi:hypothetical protein
MPIATHTSPCGNLTILPTFFKKTYGVKKLPFVNGMCLLSQVLFITSAQTGIPLPTLRAAVRAANPYATSYGLSLAGICEILSIRIAGLTFTAVRHKSVQQVQAVVQAGTPVIAVYNSSCVDVTSAVDRATGIYPASEFKYIGTPNHGGQLHALLVVGVDRQDRMLIMRESRHRYGAFRGLIKVPMQPIQHRPSSFAFIQLDAHLTKAVH